MKERSKAKIQQNSAWGMDNRQISERTAVSYHGKFKVRVGFWSSEAIFTIY